MIAVVIATGAALLPSSSIPAGYTFSVEALARSFAW
jgi:hypothetical protein